MARLRYNGLTATLGGALTSSATSVTFGSTLTHSGGTAVPTLGTGDYVPLTILDSSGNVSEIVNLTAYTSGATTGTIARGQEGTTGVAHSSGDKVMHGLTVVDVGNTASSADLPTSAPSARDDEFDGTSAATWTATPTAPNATDVNVTRRGHLWVKAAGSTNTFVGRYQAAPTSYPFTVTLKTTSSTARANFHKAGGIILLPSSPSSSSAIVYAGPGYDSTWNVSRSTYNSMGTSFVGSTKITYGLSNWYMRVVASSATSISTYVSLDGWAWIPIETGYAVPFSIANIGVGITEEGGGGVESFIDFFRVS